MINSYLSGSRMHVADIAPQYQLHVAWKTRYRQLLAAIMKMVVPLNFEQGLVHCGSGYISTFFSICIHLADKAGP